MATGRVLKNLLLMSALSAALVFAAPSQARERYLGQHHEYQQRGGDRHYGHSWNGHRKHHGQHGYGHRSYRHGWGHRSHGYYAPPRHYYRPHHHSHYRGCGHDGYGHSGLVGLLVEYSRYDD